MKKMLVAAMLAATLAGCATTGKLSSDERLQLYRSHAGAPVNSFKYFGSLNGWTELGDSALAVWTRPNEAWLLNLGGPCMDLSYAPAITVTDDTVGTFSVSTAAVRSFVQRIVVNFPSLELKSVTIMETHDGKALDI